MADLASIILNGVADIQSITATGVVGIAGPPGNSGTNGTNGLNGLNGSGAGDMVLASAQTVTGAKTFNAGTLLDKGNEVFNVKAYGAVGDGTTDDSTAIQNAINAANTAGGGTVILPHGTYRVADYISTPNSGNVINMVGAGIDSTIIKANAALDNVFAHQTKGVISDITFDGNRQTTNGLVGIIQSGGIAIDRMDFVRVKARNIKPSGMWVFVVWDQTSSYAINELHVSDVIVEGPSNTVADGFAISYINIAYFTNFTLRDMTRSPNFYAFNYLIINGMYVTNIPNFAGFVINDGVAYMSNVRVDANCAQPIIMPNSATIVGGEFACGVAIGGTGGPTTSVTMTGTKLAGLTIGAPLGKLLMDNCEVIAATGVGAGIWDNCPGGSTINYLEVTNSYFDVTLAVGTRWLGSPNANTWDKCRFINCIVVGGSGIYNITKGAGFQIKNTTGIPDYTAFYGATSIDQPTTSVAAATFTANSGTAVNDASTFDGYTVKQIVKALRNEGLLQ